MINKADLPGDLDTLWARVKADEQLSESEVRLVLSLAQRPGLLLLKLAPDDPRRLPGCWLGGEPTLPDSIEWPWSILDGRRTSPMHFMGQIDLRYLPLLPNFSELPTFGTLFFFCDNIHGELYYYEGASKVIYVPDDVSRYSKRQTPDMPQPDENYDCCRWYKERPTASYTEWFIRAAAFTSYDKDIALSQQLGVLADEELDRQVLALHEQISGGGELLTSVNSPDNFAMHNMFCGAYGSDWPEGKLPLLTIFRDDDLDYRKDTYDGIAFWISKNDLMERNFSNAYVSDWVA